MTCNACGDAPKKKDNSFTKAVVEINNPETLILFRKVVVPASLGDDTAIPPAVGKYHNVLLYYEANGRIYLYSSDGIPTLISNGEPHLDYSTNEINTNTKWVDGKYIYKKTINFGLLPARAQTKTIPHEITNLELVVKVDSFCKNLQDNHFYPLPFAAGSSYITFEISPTVIAVSSNRNNSENSDAYFTIYYTKSS